MEPPLVHGVAALASLLYAGRPVGEALDLIGPAPEGGDALAGWLMDRAWLAWLNHSPAQAAALQAQALELARVFRVRGGDGLRLLGLAAPGDLMINTPLDFICAGAGLALDLAFQTAGVFPEHDAAIVAASESAPAWLDRLVPAYAAWPRPILNDPARIRPMTRTWLPQQLAGRPGLTCAPSRAVTAAELRAGSPDRLLGAPYPLLLRPAGSHAGHGLARLDDAASLARIELAHERYILSQFIDYRSVDGLYRKRRVAFVDGAPFLCHMAVSEHWMVHYLNAGMDEDAGKRAQEARAMAAFDGFIARHALGLAGVVQAIGLDFFSIDCADAPDGTLLVFEADVAGIIHSLDPPDVYPYKRPAMQRCYDAFAAMVRGRAVPGHTLPGHVTPGRALPGHVRAG